MSFTFGHTHPGIVGTKSPPGSCREGVCRLGGGRGEKGGGRGACRVDSHVPVPANLALSLPVLAGYFTKSH